MGLKPTMLEHCDIRLRCTQNPLSPKPSAIPPHLSSRLAPMIARLSSLAAGSCTGGPTPMRHPGRASKDDQRCELVYCESNAIASCV
eukprot:6595934-Prymnesium_polylepis.1